VTATLRYHSLPGRHSSAVEQLFRKQQVLGSNPSVGSTLAFTTLSAGRWTEGTVVFTDVTSSGPLWLDYARVDLLAGGSQIAWSIEIP
jgi:hypothetical protein